MKQFDLSLYLVLDADLCQPLSVVETAKVAVAGGVTMVQLRDKKASTEKLIQTGQALKAVLAGTGVPLIVNDNLEAALAIGAAGVHIGQEDLPVAQARTLIGEQMILGLSIETTAAAQAVDARLVDYLGVGPVFATATKPDHKRPIGLTGLQELIALSTLPSVAIGGLKAEHVAAVIQAGAQGLAVVSAICGQANPALAANQLAQSVAQAKAKTQI